MDALSKTEKLAEGATQMKDDMNSKVSEINRLNAEVKKAQKLNAVRLFFFFEIKIHFVVFLWLVFCSEQTAFILQAELVLFSIANRWSLSRMNIFIWCWSTL